MATLKQKKLAKNLGKSRSMTEAMLKAGYAPTTAHQQTNITQSEGWKDLLEKHLPDNKLLVTHTEALEATKIVTSHTEPDYTIPDHPVRLKAVELGYKLKGKMQPEEVTVNNTQNNNLQLSDEQLKRLIGWTSREHN